MITVKKKRYRDELILLAPFLLVGSKNARTVQRQQEAAKQQSTKCLDLQKVHFVTVDTLKVTMFPR